MGDAASASPFRNYFGLVEVGLVVVVLGVVLLDGLAGAAGLLGVTAGVLGVIVT